MSQYSALLDSAAQEELMREVGSHIDYIYADNLGLIDLTHPLPNDILSEEEIFTEIKYSEPLVPLDAARLVKPLDVTEVLSTKEYLGNFDFKVSVVPLVSKHGSNGNWIYSELLNKMFIIKDQRFPVDISVNGTFANPILIRVTPQYHSQSFANVAVIRCVQHGSQDEKSGVGSTETRQHVIRSFNKEAVYIGNAENDQRLSVVFPLGVPQQGNNAVREYFSFLCQTSCADPGMNRRPIDLIFTLEDHRGNVLGRTSVGVRVCACPKRDKEKEESDHLTPPRPRKRKWGESSSSATLTEAPRPDGANAQTVGQAPHSSDRGAGTSGGGGGDNDNKRYQVLIPVVGKQRMLELLKYAEKLHLAGAYETKNTPLEDTCRQVAEEIRQMERQAE